MAVSESASDRTPPGSQPSATLSGDTRTGRPPTTSILRSAMYYQNRIIIPETKSRQSATGAPGNRDTGSVTSNASGALMNGPNINIKPGRLANNPNPNNSNFRSSAEPPPPHSDKTFPGATSDSGFSREQGRGMMGSRGVDIVVTDTDGANRQHNKVKKKKKKSCWGRMLQVLQDNRMKDEPNAELILAVSNPQDFRLLKKVLNISFLTIGIALLVSVVIVIIYTAIAS